MSNSFGRYFDPVVNGFKRLFGIKNVSSATTRNEGFFKIKIGQETVAELSKTFSESDCAVIPPGFITVVEIPISLGRQLYAACIESILREKEAEDEILEALAKEHAEFEKILEEFDYSTEYFEDDQNYLTDLVGEDEVPDIYEVDGAPELSDSPTAYREKAKMHLKERKKFMKEATNCLKQKNKALASHYFAKAEKHLQECEEAKRMLFKILFERCFKRLKNQDCVDLHGFSVNDAVRVLDEFLDSNIEQMENKDFDVKSLMVITGRGKHSVDGVSKIKPAVCARLDERSLTYTMVNPGLLKVKIRYDSVFTEEIRG